MKDPMILAIERARKTMNENIGGPFGAAILDQNGNIVAIASNSVLRDADPTAHAEINAIRQACKVLDTHDLSGCVLYATGYPCAMCMSAIIWANIKTVYYGCTPQDADAIGFRDDFIYKFIQKECDDPELVEILPQNREECLTLFEEYTELNKQLY